MCMEGSVSERIHIVVDAAEKERYRRQAAREGTLDAALTLARGLLHRASCLRRDMVRVRTFHRSLAAAFE